jgi:phosphoglycolate phosphatase
MDLFFDLDGTLLDVSKRHHAVYAKIVRTLGGTPLSHARYWRMKRKKAAWPMLLTKSGLARKDTKRFLEMFVHEIERPAYHSYLRLFPATKRVLASLGKKHRLYLFSLRRSPRRLNAEVRALGLTPYFDRILSGHHEGSESWETKARLARRIFKRKKADAVIIGDTEADVKAAKQLGVASIAVTSGIRTETLLKRLKPDMLLRNVALLPRAVERLDRAHH